MATKINVNEPIVDKEILVNVHLKNLCCAGAAGTAAAAAAAASDAAAAAAAASGMPLFG